MLPFSCNNCFASRNHYRPRRKFQHENSYAAKKIFGKLAMTKIVPSSSAGELREQWFDATPIYVAFPVLIVFYAFSGFYFHRLNGIMNEFLTPLINGLGFIGIKIAPILIGPFDEIFLTNLSGLSFLGAATYNLASIIYIIKNKRFAGLSCIETHALLMKRKQWEAKKAWIVLRLNIYIGVNAIVVFIALCFLNSIFHWQVFTIASNGILKACLVSVYFCFSGMMPVYLFSVVLRFVVFDVSYIFKEKQTNR